MPRGGRAWKSLERRLEEKLVKQKNGCWLWTGAITSGPRGGYGLMKVPGDPIPKYVHRVVYQLHKGPIPPGKELDHVVCDNRACANPAHLRAVTHKRNARRATAKLTTRQVSVIRRSKKSRSELAERYGVTPYTIWRVQAYVTYA